MAVMGILYKAVVQVALVGFICLFATGAYTSLTMMGGGGQGDTTVASTANVAISATTAIMGLFSGIAYNCMGPRWSMVLGTAGYVLYVGALYSYNETQGWPFVVVAGAILGCGSSLVWTVQGVVVTTYATERNRGMYLALYSVIISFVGILGGLVPFVMNITSQSSSITSETYLLFLIVALTGWILSFLLVQPSSVCKADHSYAVSPPSMGWRAELQASVQLLRSPGILRLLPFMLICQWYSPYQFDAYNAALFTIRTRSLNTLFYRFAGIAGGVFFGYAMDWSRFTVTQRGVGMSITLAVLWFATTFGAMFVHLAHPGDGTRALVDITSHGYWGLCLIYCAWGFADALLNALGVWVGGCLNPDPSYMSRYTGFLIGVQSIGSVIAWSLNTVGIPALAQNLVALVVVTAGLVALAFAVPQVTDTAPESVTKSNQKMVMV
ncbi:hypothetical protein H4R35_000585 [Dimargaris xerosporica]|nr:hypothetical protein H4R35_000585 [Dimargaris xerosporica]